MSACIYMQKVSHLSEEDLHKLKRELIKNLGTDPAPGNKFECDRWAGEEHTLGSIYIELYKRDLMFLRSKGE